MDPCICLLNDNILGLSKDEYLVAIDSDDYLKRKDDKQKAQQGSMGSAIAKVKNVFKPVAWSSPLLGLVWDEPFLVGRVASGIEVCYIEANGINKDTLVQSMPELSKTKYLVRSGKGIIFAAAISELWCIRLVDIATQRQQLLAQKRFQLAIDLTVSSRFNEIHKTAIILSKLYCIFGRAFRTNQNWLKLKHCDNFTCDMPKNYLILNSFQPQ